MVRALLIVCLLAGHARADEVLRPIARQRWYQGNHGANRLVHLSITTSFLILYPVFGFVEKDVACRWCGGPNSVDAGVRNALVWSNYDRAGQMSDLSAYVMAPAVNISLVLAGTLATPSTAAFMDDVIPVAETMVFTEWVTRGIKIGIGRTRPYAHFTDRRDADDNLSAPSGHTSRAFSLVTSAAMIAHARGYKSEPYIWVAGGAIAVTTGYLRIAADRHYLTDVLTGATLGVAAGLTVPLLMSRRNVQLTPTRNGIAFAGIW